MSALKINPKRTLSLDEVKKRCGKKGIKSISALALLVPCSRESVYLAIERPNRYSRAYGRIEEILA